MMNTVIITGATCGAGLKAMAAFAGRNCRVIGVGSTKEACEEAERKLRSDVPGAEIAFFYGDMMQQREVHRLADEMTVYLEQTCEGRLHALINFAGCKRNWYTTTEEGYEQQLSLNHLAGFLLTFRLFPCLKRAKGHIFLTSGSPSETAKMNWKDIMFRKRYRPLLAYRQSKLCNMLFAHAFNIRFSAEAVRAYAVDPVKFRPEGLLTYPVVQRVSGNRVNKADAERLFSLSERLCDIEYGVYAT